MVLQQLFEVQVLTLSLGGGVDHCVLSDELDTCRALVLLVLLVIKHEAGLTMEELLIEKYQSVCVQGMSLMIGTLSEEKKSKQIRHF